MGDELAYGANTCRDVLVRRRGIEPIASESAELREHRLAFVQRGAVSRFLDRA